jgi:hypothetical protein
MVVDEWFSFIVSSDISIHNINSFSLGHLRTYLKISEVARDKAKPKRENGVYTIVNEYFEFGFNPVTGLHSNFEIGSCQNGSFYL